MKHLRHLQSLFLFALFCGLMTAGPSAAQSPGASMFEQRVTVEAVRNRVNRPKGGDINEKLDRISFVVKFRNDDPKLAFDGCKAEFFVFAQSLLNHKAFKLLGVEHADFSLAMRGTYDMPTTEVVTRYDTSGFVFGSKYEGWVLVVRDGAGIVLTKKSSTPQWLPVAEKLGSLTVNKFYDRDLKEQKGL